MRPHSAVIGLAVLASLGLLGCAGGKDAADKELAELRTTLTKLRADQAVMSERLDALEVGRTGRAAGGGVVPASGVVGGRPDLDVVRLAPEPGETTDGDGPRPVIRALGRAGSIENVSQDRPQGPDRDFELAMELYKQKKTEKALAAFSVYLGRYPDDPHAEAVTFTRAEAYAAKGDQRRAVEQYEAVASTWPKGARAPEALLRAAQSYARLGDKNGADEAKKRLAGTYPDSEPAKKLASPK